MPSSAYNLPIGKHNKRMLAMREANKALGTSDIRRVPSASQGPSWRIYLYIVIGGFLCSVLLAACSQAVGGVSGDVLYSPCFACDSIPRVNSDRTVSKVEVCREVQVCRFYIPQKVQRSFIMAKKVQDPKKKPLLKVPTIVKKGKGEPRVPPGPPRKGGSLQK